MLEASRSEIGEEVAAAKRRWGWSGTSAGVVLEPEPGPEPRPEPEPDPDPEPNRAGWLFRRGLRWAG